jgi:hypothetical protein
LLCCYYSFEDCKESICATYLQISSHLLSNIKYASVLQILLLHMFFPISNPSMISRYSFCNLIPPLKVAYPGPAAVGLPCPLLRLRGVHQHSAGCVPTAAHPLHPAGIHQLWVLSLLFQLFRITHSPLLSATVAVVSEYGRGTNPDTMTNPLLVQRKIISLFSSYSNLLTK